jgi:D-arabinose 1-dehydrogenase-like Zn-dependent alcohol dehydrogenase
MLALISKRCDLSKACPAVPEESTSRQNALSNSAVISPVAIAELSDGSRSLSGSNIGIFETQEVLNFCGAHNITADVEVIPIQKVHEAYEGLLKSDVKCRFYRAPTIRSFRCGTAGNTH